MSFANETVTQVLAGDTVEVGMSLKDALQATWEGVVLPDGETIVKSSAGKLYCFVLYAKLTRISVKHAIEIGASIANCDHCSKPILGEPESALMGGIEFFFCSDYCAQVCARKIAKIRKKVVRATNYRQP